ncbi:uncharacterized protein [Asterias amurensis]|uniref:uncharacterized protein n=1 Tax=Asterias amurensis TaxID=7602 RepID=UPI003AB17B54
MPAKRPASSDQLDPCEEYVDEFSGDLDNWREGDVCISPAPSFRQAKPRPRHGQARVPEWVLHELERPTCPNQSQRANDIITRHVERRSVARHMLSSSIPSPPSPMSHTRDEFDYSSDFTEEDEEDTLLVGSTCRRVLTKISSDCDEMLPSPDADDEDEDYEIKQLMKRRGRRFTKGTTTTQSTDLGSSRGDGARTAAKKPKAAGSMVQDQIADGRNVIPHQRLLEPWKLPPIANLTKKGPVNLIHTTATNSSMTVHDTGLLIISASEEMLLKSIQAKTRRRKKLERRHNKKRKTENK